MNKSKGITLIALVITIVVLIILAGVTLNLTLGENGIFKKAEQAKEEYINSQIDEEVSINTISEQLMGDKKAVGQITLSQTNLTIFIEETAELTATISPSDATNKNIKWSSTNTNVATVENGIVTAIAPGTTTIVATAEDDSTIIASCEITVKNKVYLIKNGTVLVGMTKSNISSVTQNEGYIQVLTSNVTDRANYYTSSAIDFSNYSNIKVDIEVLSKTGSTSGSNLSVLKGSLFAENTNPSNTIELKGIAIISGTSSLSRQTFTIDVSDINTRCFFTFLKNANASTTQVRFNVYNLWLEE